MGGGTSKNSHSKTKHIMSLGKNLSENDNLKVLKTYGLEKLTLKNETIFGKSNYDFDFPSPLSHENPLNTRKLSSDCDYSKFDPFNCKPQLKPFSQTPKIRTRKISELSNNV